MRTLSLNKVLTPLFESETTSYYGLIARAVNNQLHLYDNASGIYAVTVDDEVIFVGQSSILFTSLIALMRNILDVNKIKDYKYFRFEELLREKCKLNIIILEFCKVEELDLKWKYYINKYNSILNKK